MSLTHTSNQDTYRVLRTPTELRDLSRLIRERVTGGTFLRTHGLTLPRMGVWTVIGDIEAQSFMRSDLRDGGVAQVGTMLYEVHVRSSCHARPSNNRMHRAAATTLIILAVAFTIYYHTA